VAPERMTIGGSRQRRDRSGHAVGHLAEK
jgi:hypothetical protein